MSGAQWDQGIYDAQIEARVGVYEEARAELASAACGDEADLGRTLRGAAMTFSAATRDLCDRLDVLRALDPAAAVDSASASRFRELAARDAGLVLRAVSEGTAPPSAVNLPTLPKAVGEERDLIEAVFGVAASDAVDDAGSFCDSRVIAHYRLRLPELQRRCDPVMRLVATHPPSVFTAVSAVRDLATSQSPFVSLHLARGIRELVLNAHRAHPDRTVAVLAEMAGEMDQESLSFERLRTRLRSAESATTDRHEAVALLEAYKHMAEGLTRRWVWTLLRLTGVEGTRPTVGVIGEAAVARLGETGAWVDAALAPALRNAEAHEDFAFDEDSGLLFAGRAQIATDEIRARLAMLDTLQRAWIVGRLAAFADCSELGGDREAHGFADSSALTTARLRFGHAGQRVRKFARNRDVLEIWIDGLRPEACNPCFLALTQSARVLPTVSRFVVHVRGAAEPVIDLPAGVLNENWLVLSFAATGFAEELPQVTFLPCLAWVQLTHAWSDEAARVAAWLAFNDASHAVRDGDASLVERARLPQRLLLVEAAVTATLRLLPPGEHTAALRRAARLARSTAEALPELRQGSVTVDLMLNRFFRHRDRLGEPPALLPALDATPMRWEDAYPHSVS